MIDGRRERARAGQLARERRSRALGSKGLGANLARRGVRADAITAAGILLAGATGVAIGLGAFYLACAGLLVGGLMDTLDGVVAKAAGTASARGAFFDSVSDRVADGLMFGGLAFYFLDGHHPKLALLPIAILGVSAIVSYERAKAESLGFSARGGLMERAERLIVFGLALLIHVVMIPMLIALLVLTTTTAIGRFVRVWRQASGKEATGGARGDLWRAGIDARWRRWKAEGQNGGSRRSRSDIEPLTTRLRGVLSGDRAGERPRRERPVRGAAARAAQRRLHDTH